MGAFSCCSSTLKLLSQSAAKSASARLRQLGFGSVHPDWAGRAQVCETCRLRVIASGNSYCGNPFLRQIHRDPATDGCGCPIRAKAKALAEHCPVDSQHRPALRIDGRCTCKWCR